MNIFIKELLISILIILLFYLIIKRNNVIIIKPGKDQMDNVSYYADDINDIIFIHVGKTGGSTMKSVFNFKEIHHQVATFNKNKKYIISIRHPIKRLISAYNMSKSLIIHNDLGVSNKQALTRFKKNGYYYTEEYDRIFKKFKSLNDLCEKIFTSDDAYNLVTSTAPSQHLGKNMSWYLCLHG